MTASAYVIGVSVAVILLIISAFVANAISFRPDNSDCHSRKVWFWIISVFAPVLTFAVAYLFVYGDIKVPTKQDAYMTAMGASSILSFILYVILGFVLAKANKHGKIGNWF